MLVDPRRDHSFKVPRPDLSEKLDTPNACTQCHDDRSDNWAAAVLDQWLGREWRNRAEFATAFHQSRSEGGRAGEQLMAIATNDDYASIIQATAYSEMANYISRDSLPTIRKGLKDTDPLVRSSAVTALASAPPRLQFQLLPPWMGDPSKVVRLEISRIIAGLPEQWLAPGQTEKRQELINEYISTQQLHADSAAGRINLGQFYLKLGYTAQAIGQFEQAINIEPRFDQAYIPLSSAYHRINNHANEKGSLQKGLKANGTSGSLHQAMGLFLVRQKQIDAAIGHLQQAAELLPDNPRFVYVYGVALYTKGDVSKAIQVLKRGSERFPDHRDIENALKAYLK